MTEVELLQILARDEDRRHQFRRDRSLADDVTAERAALTEVGSKL